MRIGWAFALAALMVGGCGPKFEVHVDGLAAPGSTKGATYALLPADKNTPPDDLQFREFADQAHRALAKSGYQRRDNPSDANLVVFLGYGIGPPRQEYFNYSVPVYGQTGSTSQTTGTVQTYGGYGTINATTTSTPTYGLVGYSNQVGTVTLRTRWALLDAYDGAASKAGGRGVKSWETMAVSDGTSSDLRLVFPAMLAAMQPAIGTSTGKQQRISIADSDPAVTSIRDGKPQAKK